MNERSVRFFSLSLVGIPMYHLNFSLYQAGHYSRVILFWNRKVRVETFR